MDNQDYIRKAVELADGWHIGELNTDVILTPDCSHHSYIDVQSTLDALAAQLVRQVDAIPVATSSFIEFSSFGAAKVTNEMAESRWVMDSDRTLNTIKAIVDSGVLNG